MLPPFSFIGGRSNVLSRDVRLDSKLWYSRLNIGRSRLIDSPVSLMNLKVGFELVYDCPQPVPMILLVNVHFSRAADIIEPEVLTTDPFVPVIAYRDAFGNWCSRLIAPAGRLLLRA